MSWFANLSVRWKLLGAFGLVDLLTGGAGAYATYRLMRTTQGVTTLVDQTIGISQRQLVSVNTAFITRHKLLKDVYLFNTNPDKVQTTEHDLAGLDAQVASGLDALAGNPTLSADEHASVVGAQAGYRDYLTASNAAVAKAKEAGDPYQLQQAAAALTSGKDKPISAALDALQKSVGSRADQDALRLESEANAAPQVVFGVLALAVLVAVGMGLFLSQNLASPLKQMAAAANGVAEGDLDQTLSLDRQDEIGLAVAALRRAIAYLRGIAQIADAMADGDLSRTVVPKSGRDVVGTAFESMIGNLRDLVGQVHPPR